MRRGLLAWDRREVPARVLEARVERCREAMRRDGLEALAVYTSFPRPAAVSWLTHFVPYWSQGLLLVLPESPPTLLISLSKRVAGWIEETAHLGGIVCTPRIGAEAASLLRGAGARRIGVVELAKLPGGIARPMIAGLDGGGVEDASRLFRGVRHPADEAEIALTERAAAIAESALAAAEDRGHTTTATLIEAVESAARLAGAEEVQVAVAPDLDADPRLQRMEGSAALGARCAVRASVAYKGHWVRVGRTLDPEGGANPNLAGALAALGDGRNAEDALSGLSGWTVEGCVGTAPQSILAFRGGPAAPLPAGSVVNVAGLADADGRPVFFGAPILLGREPGSPARPLTAV